MQRALMPVAPRPDGDAETAPSATRAADPEAAEAAGRTARRVRAAIVRREQLHVLVPLASVDLVLDAEVGEVHLVIEVRQVVLQSPVADFVLVSVGPAVALGSVAVVVLQERLVLALQVLFEHDAAHLGSPVMRVPEARLREPVGGEQVRVVVQFAGLADAGVERLTVLVAAGAAVGFQQVQAAVCERHALLVVAQRDRLDQALLVQVRQGVVPVRRTRRGAPPGHARARRGTRPRWPACGFPRRSARRRGRGPGQLPARGRAAGRGRAARRHAGRRSAHGPRTRGRGHRRHGRVTHLGDRAWLLLSNNPSGCGDGPAVTARGAYVTGALGLGPSVTARSGCALDSVPCGRPCGGRLSILIRSSPTGRKSAAASLQPRRHRPAPPAPGPQGRLS